MNTENLNDEFEPEYDLSKQRSEKSARAENFCRKIKKFQTRKPQNDA